MVLLPHLKKVANSFFNVNQFTTSAKNKKTIAKTLLTAAAQVYSFLHGNVNVTKLQSVMPCLAFFIILAFEFQEEFKALPNTWPYFHGFMLYQLRYFTKLLAISFFSKKNKTKKGHFISKQRVKGQACYTLLTSIVKFSLPSSMSFETLFPRRRLSE